MNKRMRKRLAVALLMAGCPATVALAGWQYAAWGMSYQDVVKASKGLAVRDDKARILGDASELAALYRDGGLEYDVGFIFNRGKLWSVVLTPTPKTDCRRVVAALEKQYGDHIEKNAPRKGADFIDSRTWHDKGADNLVELWSARGEPDGCRITLWQLSNQTPNR